MIFGALLKHCCFGTFWKILGKFFFSKTRFEGERVFLARALIKVNMFSMPSCLLDAANSLHPNLQFTLEKTNSEGNLPFLDLNINGSQGRRVSCSWYQKPTDTGTILNYRSCAPTQYKRSVIQGTVHRVFRCTSSWEQFDKAMETNRAQWLTNQYPENWSAKVASDALCKIIEGKGKHLDSDRGLSVQSPKDVKPPMLMVQYRGNQSQYFANRLRKLTNVQVVFTTRKLQS